MQSTGTKYVNGKYVEDFGMQVGEALESYKQSLRGNYNGVQKTWMQIEVLRMKAELTRLQRGIRTGWETWLGATHATFW